MASLCDRCFAPGACCKGLHLSGLDDEPYSFWSDSGVDGIREQLRAIDLPFEPKDRLGGPWIDTDSGRPYETWVFNCPKLGVDGRCMIYEDRPALCRSFEPASNQLCVHFGGAESGDPTIAFPSA